MPGATPRVPTRRAGTASRSTSRTAAASCCGTSAAWVGSALEPDLGGVGPDAAEIGRAGFRARVGRGVVPVKARIMDQSVLAGVGNLLADEALWRARQDPRQAAGTLTEEQLDRLWRAIRAATRDAIRLGGVHTGKVIPHRVPRRQLPPLRRADGARHDRRPHHLVVQPRAGLTGAARSARGACGCAPPGGR